MGADALSDLLRAVRLSGAVFFHYELTGDWVAEAPAAKDCLPFVMPSAQHLIEYHVVTQGSCWGGLAGEAPVHLRTGDVIVFPQGDGHILSSAPGMRSAPDMTIYKDHGATQLPFLHVVGEGGSDQTQLVCGFLGCDARPFNPLLAALPRMIRIGESDGTNPSWLGQFAGIAMAESRAKRAGGESVLARMSELMFVEAVRRHLESLPAEQTGWLAGLRDRFVGRALNLLHGDPARAWTLAELAKETGVSRSALAERFTHLLGQPPMQYLAHWRMQIAATLLASDSSNIRRIAAEVGYDSEAAFSRAFKKLVGMPPAAWRKSRAGGGSESPSPPERG